MISKANLAKVLGWVAAAAIAVGAAVQQQSVLPHDLHGWVALVSAALVGAAIHHASSTDGSK